MSTDRATTLRHEILTQCYGYRPAARDAEHIARLARRDGEVPDATPAAVEIEAAYLVGKGLLELERDEVARAEKRWRITAAGIDYLEEWGLA